MEFIDNFINQVHPLSDDALSSFKGILINKSMSKNEVFVTAGEYPTKFYLLKKGIARTYFVDKKGKEHIRSLFTPVTTTGALVALIKKCPSPSTYDCLTDCDFIEGDYYKFIELAKSNHELALLHVKILEIVFLNVVKRIGELSTLNATERYIKIKKEIPDVDNLIPQYHIASYLNITPVQLSRIRKELYSK
mgnify:CR=1 FL=1